MTRIAMTLPGRSLLVWHHPSGWPASVTRQLLDRSTEDRA